MSNNYFNFKIPEFNEKYGTDWDSFKTITDDNVDHLMNKTYQLYWLLNPDYFTTRVVEIVLESLGIEYSAADTLATKKIKVRQFISSSAYKGLGELYLDLAEAVVGIRGTITPGTVGGSSFWPEEGGTENQGRWGGATVEEGNRKWAALSTLYRIYINPKTTDSDELDLIVELYRQGIMLPAFYQIYLVDDSNNILRTV